MQIEKHEVTPWNNYEIPQILQPNWRIGNFIVVTDGIDNIISCGPNLLIYKNFVKGICVVFHPWGQTGIQHFHYELHKQGK